uniref:Uncharacterized protein n=1 Tax=Sphaerodactylus townsendi TaxID=933632 RepID=A0ACB8E4Z8_9SAUR
MIEVLSQLIVDYPEVKRWIFKADGDFGGNGTAYCDVTAHLKCYSWVCKERQKHSLEVWQNRWAHNPTPFFWREIPLSYDCLAEALLRFQKISVD